MTLKTRTNNFDQQKTKAPKPATLEHFWQMVWQERPKGIIMLNKVIELGVVCDFFGANISAWCLF
jgi:protein tyrosine phosphatase